MSALSFARQAFGREKPHSSITDWVDILTATNISEEAYDGIPELVDSISLQASGPAEASRALRKKLKHGNGHQQYRSLVLLKALVENGGQKFASTFADGHMTDALKGIANDPSADKRVKKKLTLVLAFWRDQYKDDPSMSVLANLHRQCFGSSRVQGPKEVSDLIGVDIEEEKEKERKKKKEKREAKERAKQLAREKREQEAKQFLEARQTKRAPFNFETEKPKVLTSIVEASQASNNLHNAIQLVNLETEKLETNVRVQECLEKAKQARRPVVRYIQLVENEELIGTLIETNDRLVAALDLYNQLAVTSNAKEENKSDMASNLASMTINSSASEIAQNKGKAPVDASASVYHDLEDINFGSLGASTNNLPPPMRPSALSDDSYEEDGGDHRVTLSDYSDYESSNEETHKNNVGLSSRRNYVTVSDEELSPRVSSTTKKLQVDDDPFADPFADM